MYQLQPCSPPPLGTEKQPVELIMQTRQAVHRRHMERHATFEHRKSRLITDESLMEWMIATNLPLADRPEPSAAVPAQRHVASSGHHLIRAPRCRESSTEAPEKSAIALWQSHFGNLTTDHQSQPPASAIAVINRRNRSLVY